jgi:hypothetical protein
MRLDSSGRLGLGTSSPAQRLHVSGSNAGAFQVTNADNSDAISLFVRGGNAINSTTDNAVLHVGQRSDVSIITTGRVGVGTTSPSTSLHVSNASNAEIRLGSGSYDGYIGQDSSGVLAISQAQAGSIKFQTNGSERFRCDSSGRLLVGTSSSSNVNIATFQGNSSLSTGTGIVNIALGNTSPGTTDQLGRLQFTDSGHNSAAEIIGQRDGGTWNTSTSRPTRLVFSTTADGASSPTERLRIASTGAFGLSGANYGSSGQVLTSQGSNAAPQWATPSSSPLTYISRVDASNATSASFTSGINSTYKIYVVQISELYRSGSGEFWLELSTDNGSTWSTTQYYTSASLATNPGASNRWRTDDFTGGFSTADGRGACTVYLSNLNTATNSSFYCIGNMGPYRSSSHGYKLDTNQYNALRFVGETGGTLAFSGRFTLYGLST